MIARCCAGRCRGKLIFQSVFRLCALFVPLCVATAWGQKFTVLYTFGANGGDGMWPEASLIRDKAGNLYGTTFYGGAFGVGSVFKLDASGNETILHSFTESDGMNPRARVILDSISNALYGTTLRGGTPEGGGCHFGCGVVFRLDGTENQTVLHAFNGGADGSQPEGDLVRDAEGNMYGTTHWGGRHNIGTVFKVDRAGNETVVHNFHVVLGKRLDGGEPMGRLVLDDAGNLYGTTLSGGDAQCECGTVFKIDKYGKETILHRFKRTDGAKPVGDLIRDAVGNLYGTTSDGGAYQYFGTVFKLAPSGKLTMLHSFAGFKDGEFPYAPLARDKEGNLYGTTAGGGAYGWGTIFKMDKSGNLTRLYDFTYGADGAFPNGVVLDQAGNLYGTTQEGGDSPYRAGVLFKLTP